MADTVKAVCLVCGEEHEWTIDHSMIHYSDDFSGTKRVVLRREVTIPCINVSQLAYEDTSAEVSV